MGNHFQNGTGEFKTTEGRVIFFLVLIILILLTTLAILIGYANIMPAQNTPQDAISIVYDRS